MSDLEAEKHEIREWRKRSLNALSNEQKQQMLNTDDEGAYESYYALPWNAALSATNRETKG